MTLSASKCERILITPLDWGLGHTARCMPLIQYLQQKGHTVIVAGNEWQRRFINETFMGIETIHLAGYNVTYSKKHSGFFFSLLLQLPRLWKIIKQEHQWLDKQIEELGISRVISDNRYGIWSKKIPSAILTHQLQVQTGLGSLANTLLRHIHYRFLNRFDQCWVVDVPGMPNLSGALSHPRQLPRIAHYVGLLSQFDRFDEPVAEDYLLVLLSGPEPQRSILSAILWEQVKHYQGTVVFVEGSEAVKDRAEIPAHIRYYKLVTKDTLTPLIRNARYVIARSGYSTIMDLVTLNKKGILIPTPGQTEQEYLARHLSKQKIYFAAQQKNFNLEVVLKQVDAFQFKTSSLTSNDLFKTILDQWK